MQCKYGDKVAAASGMPFTDVTTRMWGVNEIAQAQKEGMISGNPDGTFAPDTAIIRAEAAKIIELAKHPLLEVTNSDLSVLSDFTDVVRGSWYEHFVAFGITNHIFEGYKDSYGKLNGLWYPKNKLTRAEAAKIIINVLGL